MRGDYEIENVLLILTIPLPAHNQQFIQGLFFLLSILSSAIDIISMNWIRADNELIACEVHSRKADIISINWN